MENNTKLILDDIQIIKNSIEKGKTNTNSVHKILIMYGVANLIYFLITIIVGITFKMSIIPIYTNIILSIVRYMFPLLYYIKIYRTEKSTSNKYYVGFLNIWMIISILLPLLQLITRVMISLIEIPVEKIGVILVELQAMGMFANVLLLLFCMVVAGYILNKKYISFISIIMLFVCLILTSIYNNLAIDVINNISFSVVGLYYYTIISVGYMSIGMLLKHGEYGKNGAI